MSRLAPRPSYFVACGWCGTPRRARKYSGGVVTYCPQCDQLNEMVDPAHLPQNKAAQ